MDAREWLDRVEVIAVQDIESAAVGGPDAAIRTVILWVKFAMRVIESGGPLTGGLHPRYDEETCIAKRCDMLGVLCWVRDAEVTAGFKQALEEYIADANIEYPDDSGFSVGVFENGPCVEGLTLWRAAKTLLDQELDDINTTVSQAESLMLGGAML